MPRLAVVSIPSAHVRISDHPGPDEAGSEPSFDAKPLPTAFKTTGFQIGISEEQPSSGDFSDCEDFIDDSVIDDGSDWESDGVDNHDVDDESDWKSDENTSSLDADDFNRVDLEAKLPSAISIIALSLSQNSRSHSTFGGAQAASTGTDIPASSPRTNRRKMLENELTNSLRRDMMWERQQNSMTADAVNRRRHTSTDGASLRQDLNMPNMGQSGEDNKRLDESFAKIVEDKWSIYHSHGW